MIRLPVGLFSLSNLLKARLSVQKQSMVFGAGQIVSFWLQNEIKRIRTLLQYCVLTLTCLHLLRYLVNYLFGQIHVLCPVSSSLKSSTYLSAGCLHTIGVWGMRSHQCVKLTIDEACFFPATIVQVSHQHSHCWFGNFSSGAIVFSLCGVGSARRVATRRTPSN